MTAHRSTSGFRAGCRGVPPAWSMAYRDPAVTGLEAVAHRVGQGARDDDGHRVRGSCSTAPSRCLPAVPVRSRSQTPTLLSLVGHTPSGIHKPQSRTTRPCRTRSARRRRRAMLPTRRHELVDKPQNSMHAPKNIDERPTRTRRLPSRGARPTWAPPPRAGMSIVHPPARRPQADVLRSFRAWLPAGPFLLIGRLLRRPARLRSSKRAPVPAPRRFAPSLADPQRLGNCSEPPRAAA